MVSGAAELAALQQVPAGQDQAVALAGVLLARAAADGEFGRALQGWWSSAEPVRASRQRHQHDQRRHPVRAGAAGPRLHGITFGRAPATAVSRHPKAPA